MRTAELNDLAFAVPDDIEIALLLTPAGHFFIRLDGGISTRLYFKLVRYQDKLSAVKGNRQMIETIKEIALAIVREDPAHADVTMEYVNEHLDNVPVLIGMVNSVYSAVGEIVSQPGLRLPNVKLPPSKERSAAVDDSAGVMRDIAFLCAHTGHTYADVMAMPYVTYQALLNNLVLSEALKDPDYAKAYELAKRKEQLKSGKIKRQKLDYEGLKRFAASLQQEQ